MKYPKMMADFPYPKPIWNYQVKIKLIFLLKTHSDSNFNRKFYYAYRTQGLTILQTNRCKAQMHFNTVVLNDRSTAAHQWWINTNRRPTKQILYFPVIFSWVKIAYLYCFHDLITYMIGTFSIFKISVYAILVFKQKEKSLTPSKKNSGWETLL